MRCPEDRWGYILLGGPGGRRAAGAVGLHCLGCWAAFRDPGGPGGTPAAIGAGTPGPADARRGEAPAGPEGGRKMRTRLIAAVLLLTALLLGPAAPGFARGGGGRGPRLGRLAWAWRRSRARRGRRRHRPRLLVGRPVVVGTRLPGLRLPLLPATGGGPAIPARVHPASAPAAPAQLLVLLPGIPRLLPVCQGMRLRVVDRRPALDSAAQRSDAVFVPALRAAGCWLIGRP